MCEPPPRPASRTATQENFPVASRLLRADVRATVLACYHLARAADDVADDPLLDRDAKLAELDRVDHAMADDLVGRTVRALLPAFRADAAGVTWPSWPALIEGYCHSSAAPIARFLLDLHGEAPTARRPAEALAIAMQVLNHIQDARDDWRRLQRSYLPIDWCAEAGATTAMLTASSTPAALRQVFDRMLAGTATLLGEAAALPGLIRDPGLRAQAVATLSLGRALHRRLATHDPLASRAGLSALDKGRAALAGLTAGGPALWLRLIGLAR